MHPYEPGTLHPGEAVLTPLSLVLAWPLFELGGRGLGGLTLAWNSGYAVALLGGAIGTWAFLREWLGERDTNGVAAAAGSVVVAAGAMLQELPDIGRLEPLPQHLYPVHLWLLYRATVSRRGGVDAVLAALSFGLLASQGGYAAALLAMVELPVAGWCLLQSTQRGRALAVLGATAITGALLLWPWVDAHLRWPPPFLLEGRDGRVSVPLRAMLPLGAGAEAGSGYYPRP